MGYRQPKDIPEWRHIALAVLIIAIWLGVLLALGTWEYLQCGDSVPDYCRERNHLGILVFLLSPVIGILASWGAIKLLMRGNR